MRIVRRHDGLHNSPAEWEVDDEEFRGVMMDFTTHLIGMLTQIVDGTKEMNLFRHARVCNYRVDAIYIAEQPGKISLSTRHIQHGGCCRRRTTLRQVIAIGFNQEFSKNENPIFARQSTS